MKRRLVIQVLAGLAVLQGGLPILRAGSFSVNPVRIELSAKQPNSMVQVTNVAAEAVTVQVEVMAWDADGDGELLRNSDDVVVNPPIFTISPQQTQVLRLGLRRPRAGALELSYRLILHEVPRAPEPGFAGVQTLLRVSLPIFARPNSLVAPLLAWRAERLSDKKVKVRVHNTGTGHIQFRELRFTASGRKEPDFVREALAYVLPSGGKEWIIEDERIARAERLTVSAKTDLGGLNEDLAIQTP